jgi:hypothetical protein
LDANATGNVTDRVDDPVADLPSKSADTRTRSGVIREHWPMRHQSSLSLVISVM